MDKATMEDLLRPFLPGVPSPELLHSLDRYLDLLLRWNKRLALTGSHDLEYIVTRHIGESLFAAAHWLGAGVSPATAMDVGSGAGFPGVPLKLYAPDIKVCLVEAHGKKATFLREVVRALGLGGISVVERRVEDLLREAQMDGAARHPDDSTGVSSPVAGLDAAAGTPAGHSGALSVRAELVTLRAVERFDTILPMSAHLVQTGGRIGLMIGEGQVKRAADLLPGWKWQSPVRIPLSDRRVVLSGSMAGGGEG